MTKVSWLHLTDLHAGMDSQRWLWPRFETEFFEDLARTHDRSGPWDVLIFSGDMVRAGTPNQFDDFTAILIRILDRCAALGSRLQVVTTPGNHDLLRPNGIDPHLISLDQLSNIDALRQDFWSIDEVGNRAFVNSCFENYTKWRAGLIDSGLHAPILSEGLIAGDATYEVTGAEGTLRVCSLNSTWMQLAEGEYKRRLIVDPLQLITLTSGAPDQWLAGADFSLLLTHQPAAWLTEASHELWQSDIYTPDRFDLHTFGHMHEPAASNYSAGGSEARRDAQGASLFGFEQTASGWARIQGYGAHQLSEEGGIRHLQTWPRRLVKMQSGIRKLRPDPTYELDEASSSFVWDFKRGKPTSVSSRRIGIVPDAISTRSSPAPFNVANLEASLRGGPGHDQVRATEQAAAYEAWSKGARAFWLSADWGLGAEAFVASVLRRAGVEEVRVFRISVADFADRLSFLDRVRVTYGITYEEICDQLAEVGPSIIFFDDAPLQGASGNDSDIVEEFEALIGATKDYLPDGKFVVQTRIPPLGASLPLIELKPLDEPDIKAYVEASQGTETGLTTVSSVERIFKLTDGHPGRIDSTLRQLLVVSLPELAMTNTDLASVGKQLKVPAALSDAVADLKSAEVIGARAYSLLGALSAFPNGEQLETVKRFNDKSQFFPQHATALLDRNLIDAVSYSKMGEQPGMENARLLSVPRPVREYVRGLHDREELATIDRKAIELYFGEA